MDAERMRITRTGFLGVGVGKVGVEHEGVEVAIDGKVVVERSAVGVDEDRLLVGLHALVQPLQLLLPLLADALPAPTLLLWAAGVSKRNFCGAVQRGGGG